MTIEQRMIQYDLESYYKNDLTSYTELLFLFDFLEQKMNRLLNNKRFVAACVKNSDKRLGYFYKAVFDDFGHPEKQWKLKGPKGRYYRIILAQVITILKSLSERQAIANVCKTHNWDKTKLADIRQDLVSSRLYPTNALLLNILRSKKVPVLPKKNKLVLDFSASDEQTSEVEGHKIRLRVQSKWIEINLEPKHLRNGFVKYHRPRLQKINGKLTLSIPYTIEIPENKGTNILGVDLGRKKAFAAVALTPDGYWSRELTPSKETNRLFEKEKVLTKELNFLYAKKNRIAGLLTNNDDSHLRNKFEKLDEHSQFVKNKRTRLKKHSAYTTARDITVHAELQGCGVIKMESLSFVSESYGGSKWNYSEVFTNLSNVAVLQGVEVVAVSAKNTSETDPWENTPAPANKNREITLRDGTKIDRDYAAAMIIASRGAKKSKKNSVSIEKKELRPRTRRDKSVPTPKRARKKSRAAVYKEELRTKNNNVGASLTVESPGRASTLINNNIVCERQHSVSQENCSCEQESCFRKITGNYSLL